mmetsp:Transcript_92089/g.231569  ORF Transcript_92089/g.231569 Transcript_92089/m.231569 type:complete len:265 (-) Transcript_92089:582-1376(-)
MQIDQLMVQVVIYGLLNGFHVCAKRLCVDDDPIQAIGVTFAVELNRRVDVRTLRIHYSHGLVSPFEDVVLFNQEVHGPFDDRVPYHVPREELRNSLSTFFLRYRALICMDTDGVLPSVRACNDVTSPVDDVRARTLRQNNPREERRQVAQHDVATNHRKHLAILDHSLRRPQLELMIRFLDERPGPDGLAPGLDSALVCKSLQRILQVLFQHPSKSPSLIVDTELVRVPTCHVRRRRWAHDWTPRCVEVVPWDVLQVVVSMPPR